MIERLALLPRLEFAAELELRFAGTSDIEDVYGLIKYWAERGRMLERSKDLLAQTIDEFLVLEVPKSFLEHSSEADDALKVPLAPVGPLLLPETDDAQLEPILGPGKGIAGCVGLHRLAPDLAEVRGLAVHPRFRGLGFGRWLVLGAERRARDLGIERLFAWTYEEQFFRRCGYTRIVRDEATLPGEIYAECCRCPFQTNCQEIPMLKILEPLRPGVFS